MIFSENRVQLFGNDWDAPAADAEGVVRPIGDVAMAAISLSPDEALAALKEGNERYVSNPELCSADVAQK